jgi:hypothetical protein
MLAFLACVSSREPMTDGRRRVLILLGVSLVGLALAWFGIERLHHLRLTLFQPFRMATIARGLCLVLLSGHWLALWRAGTVWSRIRAGLLAVGLIGDWSLVVVTAFEGVCVLERLVPRLDPWAVKLIAALVMAYGLFFLARHDTESGHWPLILALVATPILGRRDWEFSTPRLMRLTAYAWVVPFAALVANVIPSDAKLARTSARRHLVRLCRFGEVPLDDAERLAAWCRANIPTTSTIVGPPGPKTLRLWSCRNVAFNRASSPYNARGLADWEQRFADHVGFVGSPSELVRAYVKDRHGLEARYDALSPDARAALADRQAADYVIGPPGQVFDGLEPVHAEGKLTLYHRTRSSPPMLTRATR